MANPITWRNITDPAATAAGTGARSGALNSARGAFEGMSQSFTNAVQRQQGIRADNRQNEVDNNTQDFKNLLASAQTPEELEAMRAEGVFQKALDKNGRMMDQNVANQGAVDNRLTGLRTADTAEHQYQQTQTARAEAPIVDQFNARLMSITADNGIDGIDADFDQFRANVTASELSDSAKTGLLQAGHDRVNDLIDRADSRTARDRRDAAHDREEEARADQAAREQTMNSADRIVADLVANHPEGGNITGARADLRKALKDMDLSVDDREILGQRLSQRLQSTTAVDQGDQGQLEGLRNGVRQRYNAESNLLVNADWSDLDGSADGILEDYSDDDGNFFGIKGANARGEAHQAMMNGMTNGVTYTNRAGEEVNSGPIPPAAVKTALNGVQGKNFINTTRDVERVLKDYVMSDGYTAQMENYQNIQQELGAIDSNAFPGLLAEHRGNPATGQPGSDQPRPDALVAALDRAGADVAGNTNPAPEPTPETTSQATTPENQLPESPGARRLSAAGEAVRNAASSAGQGIHDFFDQVPVMNYVQHQIGRGLDGAANNAEYAPWVNSIVQDLGGDSVQQSFRAQSDEDMQTRLRIGQFLRGGDGQALIQGNTELRNSINAAVRKVKAGEMEPAELEQLIMQASSGG